MKLFLLLENPGRIKAMMKMLTQGGVDEDTALQVSEHLIDIDKSPGNQYALWLSALVNRGFIAIKGSIKVSSTTQLRLPEDSDRIVNALSIFAKAKNKPTFKHKDINKFKDFYSLEDMMDKLVQSQEVSSEKTVRQIPGANIAYNDGEYVVYRIEKIRSGNKLPPEAEAQERVKAVGKLGMGPPETKWCTRAEYGGSYASRYLSKADIYVIYKDGKPFIQHCDDQTTDVNDRRVVLPDFVQDIINGLAKQKLEANKQAILRFQEEFKINLPSVCEVMHKDAGMISGLVLDKGNYLKIFVDYGQATCKRRWQSSSKSGSAWKRFGEEIQLGISKREIFKNSHLPFKIKPKAYCVGNFRKILTISKLNVTNIKKIAAGTTTP